MIQMASLCARRIFTQSVRCGHWFSIKRVVEKKPPTHAPKYQYDWEHERWHGKKLDSYPKFLDSSELFKNASDDVKKLYSYEFMLKSEMRTDALQELYDQVGIDSFEPIYRDLATHIVYLTFAIRNLKAGLEKCHKNGKMRAACATYIGRRKGFLHQLREENIARFTQVVEALNIEYKSLDPFSFRPTLKQMRKKAVRAECHQKLQQKEAALLKALDAERDSFFAEKEATLKALNEELQAAGLDTRAVFEEVVNERREAAMEPIRKDEVEWFEREKVLRDLFIRLKTEKEERAAKKKRK